MEVFKATSTASGIPEALIRSGDKERSREVVLPRQVAVYILRRKTDMTFRKISELIGILSANSRYCFYKAQSFHEIKDPEFMDLYTRTLELLD